MNAQTDGRFASTPARSVELSQYTPPAMLLPKRQTKSSSRLLQGHTKLHISCFRNGNIFRTEVLYPPRHRNAFWGAVCKQWQVPPRFLRRALRHRSQATCPVPGTKSCRQIWREDRIPQYEAKRRTTIVRLKGMLASMNDILTYGLPASFWPLSLSATLA